jgi:hypothetical protein
VLERSREGTRNRNWAAFFVYIAPLVAFVQGGPDLPHSAFILFPNNMSPYTINLSHTNLFSNSPVEQQLAPAPVQRLAPDHQALVSLVKGKPYSLSGAALGEGVPSTRPKEAWREWKKLLNFKDKQSHHTRATKLSFRIPWHNFVARGLSLLPMDLEESQRLFDCSLPVILLRGELKLGGRVLPGRTKKLSWVNCILSH